jgi:hypothetical protein
MIEFDWHKRLIMDLNGLNESNAENDFQLRTLGALSRLINNKRVGESVLAQEAVVLRIIKTLTNILRKKRDSELVGSLVQIVAALSITKNTKLLQILREEQLFSTLALVLPLPRKNDDGIVDEVSVTKSADKLPLPHVIGNVSLGMTACLDDMMNDELNDRSEIVERIICCFVSYPDIRVRKNLAILLAKLSRYPKLKERISQLRGMEMLKTLQGFNDPL